MSGSEAFEEAIRAAISERLRFMPPTSVSVHVDEAGRAHVTMIYPPEFVEFCEQAREIREQVRGMVERLNEQAAPYSCTLPLLSLQARTESSLNGG